MVTRHETTTRWQDVSRDENGYHKRDNKPYGRRERLSPWTISSKFCVKFYRDRDTSEGVLRVRLNYRGRNFEGIMKLGEIGFRKVNETILQLKCPDKRRSKDTRGTVFPYQNK